LSEVSLVLAVPLNKLPSTAVTVREGARALDRDLAEMARSFRMRRYVVLRHCARGGFAEGVAGTA
jgi:NitT/TauT family transport system permease protein